MPKKEHDPNRFWRRAFFVDLKSCLATDCADCTNWVETLRLRLSFAETASRPDSPPDYSWKQFVA